MRLFEPEEFNQFEEVVPEATETHIPLRDLPSVRFAMSAEIIVDNMIFF
jgi:hypothetical protein